ncbi:MAG: CHAT domain-containing protein [Oscillatoria princeps RMCB-10]|jgi:CHAT domain-containing protein|nr:CHAT domain-containing protein [Oscillatoria princeps RMCB-10]
MKETHLKICLGWLSLLLVTAAPAAVALQQKPASVASFAAGDASSLIEQGKQLYESGKLSEAAAIWQQAVRDCEAKGDRLNQALILSYLSLAYQNLGEWVRAKKAISDSLNLLPNQSNPDRQTAAVLAEALNTQGSLQLATGQTEAALESWQQAEKAYRQAGDETGIPGSQINQAQAWQSLGIYKRSKDILERVREQLRSLPDSFLKADGLRSLGAALQVAGSAKEAKEILEESLAIYQRLNSPADTSATLLSLGNTSRDLQDSEAALKYYGQAAMTAKSGIHKVEALLNQLSLSLETEDWEGARALVPQIQPELANLPSSRSSVYAYVNFAGSLANMGLKSKAGADCASAPCALPNSQEIAQLLAKAVGEARALRDARAEAYALLQLGKLYEQTRQWREAKNLTERSLEIAQKIDASDIEARGFWQLGRILKQEGDTAGAISAYTQAVKTLQSLRSDLAAINSEVQFTFTETVEPVYRDLVSLLLQPPDFKTGKKSATPISQLLMPQEAVSQKNLKQARDLMESLRVAELDNYFRDACLEAQPVGIDDIDKKAAVIYPIILADRLEVILSIPGQPLRHYTTNLPAQEVEEIADRAAESVNLAFSNEERLRLLGRVYDWLIRPAETMLAESGVETLVFIPDGSFRNLPMAALYDGKQYLVEKYSIALSSGLHLLSPQALSRKNLTALTAGLTESRQGFAALPGVNFEVKQIASEVQALVLLNQNFTTATFQHLIAGSDFEVVHLATHGQFSSNAEDTFLLTWDGRINVKDLQAFLQPRGQRNSNSIQLLVLSACETAAGDKRATLGLAGLALRSGARSTVATLWSIKDDSTAQFMTDFYRTLSKRNITKAQAVRQAQLALLNSRQYKHPFFWAPFVLVGNWL